jgi:hypothetical protein
MAKQFWKHGQITELAKHLGADVRYVSAVINRQIGISQYRALAFEEASKKVLDVPVPWIEWHFNKTSTHPAFKGKPIK